MNYRFRAMLAGPKIDSRRSIISGYYTTQERVELERARREVVEPKVTREPYPWQCDSVQDCDSCHEFKQVCYDMSGSDSEGDWGYCFECWQRRFQPRRPASTDLR